MPTACAVHSRWQPRRQALALFALYLLGLGHWWFFFNGGALTWTSQDWPKEIAYYHVLQRALIAGQIPYHISAPFQGTDRFLGLPETNVSPQVLLLPWLGVQRFIVFQVLLLYSVGFAGCLLIRHRYRLGLAAFSWLFLLIHFNGYITAHLAVGHSMWSGYFLLPLFALPVLRWEEQGLSLNHALQLALVLGAMILQGAFHLAIWCWLFLVPFLLCRWRDWRCGLAMFLASGLLCLFRLGPAAAAFWDVPKNHFLGGYPSPMYLFESLTTIHSWTWPAPDPAAGGIGSWEQWTVEALCGWLRAWPRGALSLRWWEYDLYVGLVAAAALAYLGIVLRFSRREELASCRYRGLDAPILIQTLLSFGIVSAAITRLPVPLVSVERVSSRFIIVPFVLLVIISAVRLQRLLEKRPMKPMLAALLIAGLLETAIMLGWHSWLWHIARIEEAGTDPLPAMPQIVERPDPLYIASIPISWTTSLLTLLAILCIWWLIRPPGRCRWTSATRPGRGADRPGSGHCA
jgi:hypothetical protein